MRTQATNWYDKEAGKVRYGIKVFFNGDWIHAGDNNGLFLFDSEAEREAKRKELRTKKMLVRQ